VLRRRVKAAKKAAQCRTEVPRIKHGSTAELRHNGSANQRARPGRALWHDRASGRLARSGRAKSHARATWPVQASCAGYLARAHRASTVPRRDLNFPPGLFCGLFSFLLADFVFRQFLGFA